MTSISTKTFFRLEIIAYCLVPVSFIAVYFRIFYTNYAYLDEIHQLWHNNDDSNFTMFHSQGRWLTGLLFRKLFSAISTIDQIKFLRWFSFLGWVITAFTWAVVFKKWVKLLDLAKELWLLSVIYIACCISVCIYIGWASCMEVFLAAIFGLLSTHILFTSLFKQQGEIQLTNKVILGVLVFGVVSLFFYQPAFGIFLLPFLLRYIKAGKSRPDRVLIIAIGFYFATYIIYYLFFKYVLRDYHLEASARTQIHFNILKKISFFFSGPFPQGFSMNLLFYAGSIFSQVFYPAVFLLWLVISFKRNQQKNFTDFILFIAFIFLMLVSIYLPSMIAVENFPSYRTLFVFNLTIFIMVVDSLLYLFKRGGTKKIFTALGVTWLLITGFYAFNFQFIIPLKKEYEVIRKFFEANYRTSTTTIYFIRADKFLFSPEFHTKVYRDEFGAPSTYRDWVPEPMVKQMIFELTGQRAFAERTIVKQFENKVAFDRSAIPIDDTNSLVIDMNSLFAKNE
jgi:hypothetical protein